MFDYGEHDRDDPHPLQELQPWSRRNDPFSSYRSGFEVRTYRLCQRVLMFHHFAGEPGVGENCLVRSTELEYSFEADPDNARNPIYSFVVAAVHAGFRRRDQGGLRRSAMPAVEFEYSQPIVDERVRDVDPESLRNLPYGADDTGYCWTDLDGEGAPGILTNQAERWYYKRNESPATGTDDGIESTTTRFGPLQVLSAQPARASLSGAQQLLDLGGDGQLDLVELGGASPGYYERTQQGGWAEHIPFKSLPGIEWADPNVRFIDLTGDGHADVLITENDAYCWHASLAEAGF
ncbi:MAG: SpvB/TcaC N-terminal domain-containing protein, partial [Burkholderiales bacterium]